MSANAWILTIVLGLWVPISIAGAGLLVRHLIHATWNRIADAHPAVEPAPDAVRRNFQSFKMDLLNLGLSVHVAADERCLHLAPGAIIRVFGARPASIPWQAIEARGTGLTPRTRRVRIEGVTVWGPAWCLGLAEPRESATPPAAPPPP